MNAPPPRASSRPVTLPIAYSEPANPLSKVGLVVVVVFFFCVFSGLLDLIPFLRPIRPLMLIGGLGLVIAGVTGRMIEAVTDRIGMSLLIFTGWMILTIPFSIWRGGSFGVFADSWYKSVLIYFLAAGLILHWRHCRTVLFAIGCAPVLTAVVALHRKDNIYGRLILDNTRYGNPNDFALTLLMGLPFLGFMFLTGGKLLKALSLLMSLPVLLALARTGSRAGLIGLGMLVLVLFWYMSVANKVKMLILAPVLLLFAVLFTPPEMRDRYFTFFTADPEEELTDLDVAAIGSTHGRLELLKDSIYLTFTHPLFGVGPGNFPVAQDEMAKARGASRGSWHVTHNTYTEISSEMGIPALLIYCLMLAYCWKSLTAVVRIPFSGHAWTELRLMASSLRICLATFCAVAIFGSYTYLPIVPILAGMSYALYHVARQLQGMTSRVVARGPVRTPVYAARQPRPIAT